MAAAVWAVVVAAVCAGAPAVAFAQDDDVAAREAEMFGAPVQDAVADADDAGVALDDGDDEDDDVAAREAEMFGAPVHDAPVHDASIEPAGFAPEATSPVEDREQSLFGGAGFTSSEASIAQRLEERFDPLAVGGRLYLRANQRFDRGEVPEGQPQLSPAFSTPALVDLYLDARPSDRLRAYVTGRVNHDFSVGAGDVSPLTGEPRQGTRVALDQLWVHFDVGQRLYVTAGRQHLRWGVGRFWNPTDFLYAQRRDPLAIVDERLGTSLVKLHLPVEGLGWNFYAVANFEGVSAPEDVGGALRGEFLFGVTEIALSAALQSERPLQLGASLSSGLGLFDVRGEVAVLNGVRDRFWEGDLRVDLGDLALPTAYGREDDWIVQASVGAEVGLRYNDDDQVYFGAEYFFNDAGYDGSELYPWLVFQGGFRPLYVGRHYAALYALLPSPGRLDDTTFTLSALSNLSDRSWLARFDYRVRVLTHMSVYAWAMLHGGNRGEFRMGFELPPVDFIPQLEEGLTVPEPLLSLGAGLSLSF